MGKALAEAYPAAQAVFDTVDDALGEKLSNILWNGPNDTLTLTQNAQPGLMAVSLAAIAALRAEGIEVAERVAYVAGHSLGEYSALAAAGSLSIADAARLLRARGLAMQQAVPVGEGGMAALLGIDLEAARQIADAAAQGGVCNVANDNADGQVVVSGDMAAVERAVEIAQARGARRAVMLPVSAPFHCELMAPAAETMANALSGITINPPVVPLVANITARPITEPSEIRKRLVEQVTGMVRWRESVAFLAEAGVDRFGEIGAGKVLSGLVRRIAADSTSFQVATPDDVRAALAQFEAP